MSFLRNLVKNVAMASTLLLSLNACGPTYPNCETDEHCAEQGEFCVGELCKQCKEDANCTEPGKICVNNSCQYKNGYCDANRQCAGNQKCRNNVCGAECLDNSECGAGQFCDNGSCSAKPECGPNADKQACDEGYNCVAGRCQLNLTQCRPSEPIYFDFDKSNIRKSEIAKLKEVLTCLTGKNVAQVMLSGHTDLEGSEEYNISLGDARAKSVETYLQRANVPASLLSTVSYGESRPAVNTDRREARNRRVEFDAR
jgi:peptidoglycan-associated lipoprotein